MYRWAPLLLLAVLAASAAAALAAGDWYLVSSSFASPQGGPVYPGSDAVLRVGLRYTGTQTAENVSVCLTYLPAGFTLASPVCSSAGTVEPGAAVSAEWRIHVSSSVEPGAYNAIVTVYYSVNGTPASSSSTVILRVERLPRPVLAVREAYWESGGVPGSRGTLVLVVENRGNATVEGGTASLEELPEGFTASRAAVPQLPPGGLGELRFTVTVPGDAEPGGYEALLRATLEATAGGARYTATVEDRFTFNVSAAPSNIVSIIDWGLAPSASSAPGGVGQRLYMTLRVERQGATIRHVYAYWSILDGAVTVNGSSQGLTVYTGAWGHGDSLTIESPGLRITGPTVRANVTLLLHVEENGTSYWVRLSRELEASTRQPGPVAVVEAYWSPGPPAPGSSADLVIVIDNRGPVALGVDAARLLLPEGWEPPIAAAGPLEVPAGGRASIRFTISVPVDASPGVYNATLVLRGSSVSGGASAPFEARETLLLRVREPPGPGVRLAHLGWGCCRAPPPGSHGLSVEAVLVVEEPDAVLRMVEARLVPGPGVWLEAGSGYAVWSGSLGQGGAATLTIGGVGVAPGLREAPMVLELHMLVERGGAAHWYNVSIPASLPLDASPPPLRLVDASIEPPLASPGSPASLRILLQWLSPTATLDTLVARARLLHGATAVNGSSSLAAALGGLGLAYGSTASIQLRPLLLAGSEIKARIELAMVARLPGGGSATYREVLNVTAALGGPEPVTLLGAETLVQGSPAPLLPGQRGVVLRLVLANNLPWQVSIAVNESSVELPGGVRLLSAGSCTAPPAASCSLDLVLETSGSIEPGAYEARIPLLLSYDAQGAPGRASAMVAAPLAVADPRSYAPRLAAVAAHWGRPGAPGPGYAWSGPAWLTVYILNLGHGAASGVTVRLLEPAPLDATTEPCAASLQPGGYCSTSFLVDLSDTPPGTLEARLEALEVLSQYASNATVPWRLSVEAPVASPPREPRLRVVEAGWENGAAAFPGDDARLVVTVANEWPYPVRGVYAVLETPWGRSRAWLDGPLGPGASAQLTFNVSIPRGAGPGSYQALLRLDYIVDAAGAPRRATGNETLVLEIGNVSEAFSLAEAEWLPAPPGSGADAVLRLALRLDAATTAQGPVLRLTLPEGLVDARTGSREASVAPSAVAAQPLPQVGGAAGLLPLLQAARVPATGSGGSAEAVLVPRGGIIVYEVPVRVVDAAALPTTTIVRGVVEFVDSWGSRIEAPVEAVLPPPGAPRLVVRLEPQRLRLVNGTAAARLVVENHGTGPALDVEAIVAPTVPLLVPAEARLRLGTIPPGGRVEAGLLLLYNPGGSSIWGDSGPSYASVAFTVALRYATPMGSEEVYNTSVAALLEPLIDIVVLDAKAEQRGATLTVGGVLANRGTSTARSVTVSAEAGEARAETFIGDLEAGGQTAFRLDLEPRGRVEKVKLVITYLDDYGAAWRKTLELPVVHTAVNTSKAEAAAPGETGSLELPVAPVAAGVAAFLAAAAFMIQRFLRRAEEGIAQQA